MRINSTNYWKKMKSVEEMIKSKTPEEWDQIIKEEMERLGLRFKERDADEASLSEDDRFYIGFE